MVESMEMNLVNLYPRSVKYSAEPEKQIPITKSG
jgi:hypothetical protein